jgi:hypothetical protein
MPQPWSRIVLCVAVLIFFASITVTIRAQEAAIPRVWSMVPSPVQGANASFLITFSEAVNGVDVTDFRTSSTGTSAVTAIRPGANATIYTIDVEYDASATEILLLLSDDDSIVNVSGVPLGGIGTQNGNAMSTAYTTSLSAFRTQARAAIAPRYVTTGAGTYNSIALTDTGNPVVSYYDEDESALKLARCSNLGCSDPQITTVASDIDIDSTSIALTSGNIPVIAFIDDSPYAVTLAICDTITCASPTFAIIDSQSFVTQRFYHPKIVITNGNIPIVTYTDHDALMYVRCGNPTCTTKTSVTMRATGIDRFSGSNAMALTSTGIPYVSYSTGPGLSLTICNNAACAAPTNVVIDGSVYTGYNIGLQLTALNIPIISFYDRYSGDLKLAICNNIACTLPQIKVIDSVGYVGHYLSLALTSAGVPMISYYDSTNAKLKLATCADTSCSSATLTTLDNTGSTGSYTSLALTTQDTPVISYVRDTSSDLSLRLYTGTITVDNGQPEGFAKTAPLNNAIVPSTSTILSWSSVTGATSYEYCFVVLGQFCNNWTSTGTSTTAGFFVTHGTTYDWQVRAKNSTGVTVADNAERWVFSVVLPPTAFSKTSPVDNSVSSTTNTTLTWGASTYAIGYEYCIYPSVGSCTSWTSAGTATSVAVTGLSNNSTYSWSVRATNAGGTTIADSGAISRIIITTPPTAFSKTSPAYSAIIATSNTTLTWGASTNATGYEYCIYPSSSSCTTWISTSTATSVAVTGLSNNSTYSWSVRATNAGGTTLADSGTSRSFTVRLPPVAFAKTAPANNASNQKTSVTLAWTASSLATSYEYCIALTTATCTTWKSTGTVRTAAVTGLAKNKAYYWQVRAKNTGGTTLSSSTFWKFTTAP